MQRRVLLTFGPAWLAATTGARAQGRTAPHNYAVLSLVGDVMNVVTYQVATGSNIDRNSRVAVPVPGEVFDQAALLTTEETLKKLDASATVQLLAISTPSLFTEQTRLFDGGRLVLPERLAAAVKGSGASQLLLFTKHRAEARMQFRLDKVGSGMVEGLGFYIDRDTYTSKHDGTDDGRGFLAPFAFFEVSLINLADFRVVRQKAITASAAYPAGRIQGPTLDPWETLSAEEKFATLRHMLEEEVSAAIPALVNGS